MAAGSIIFDLLMRTASFETDTNRAAKLAEKRVKEIQKEFKELTKSVAIGFAAVTAAIGGPLLAIDQLVKGVAAFQDISEKTGGSSQVFASFAVAAAVAGTSVEQVAAASVRLSVGLSKVDDESKGAGKALEAIGINLENFRKLDPAQQMDTVAKALAEFEDGSTKTAVAVALFGKAGAELLPFLKELGNQTTSQNALTKEQIALADDYADNQARFAAEFKQFLQFQAVKALPTLIAVKDAFAGSSNESEKFAVAIDVLDFALKGVITVFQTLAVVGSDVGFVFLSMGREIAAWASQIMVAAETQVGAATALMKRDIKGLKDTLQSGAIRFTAISDAVKEDGERARAALDKFQSKIMALGTNMGPDEEALRRRGHGVSTAKQLDFTAVKDSGKDKAETEFTKQLKHLDQLLQKTRELSNEEKILAEIKAGRLKVTDSQKDQLITLAREVDTTKTAIKVAEDRAARRKKDDEEAVEGIRAIEEAERNRLKNLMGNTPSVMLQQQRSDVEFLTKAFEDAKISETEYLEAVTTRLDLTADKTNKAKSFAEELGLTFSSAWEDAISGGKSFSDVLKGIGSDILKLGVRKYVTEPFLEMFKAGTTSSSSSGASSGGSDGFGSLFSAIGSLFGGSFAEGGNPPMGKVSLVGERGPELFVPSTSGTVVPNSALKSSVSVTYSPTIQVDSRSDQAQVEALVTRAVQAGNTKLVSDLQVAGVL